MDKVLAIFDSISEWADLIGFLSALGKLIRSCQLPIPRKLIISKRLAQCLNPALPTGVHQRTLDVLVLIFQIYSAVIIEIDPEHHRFAPNRSAYMVRCHFPFR